jgi:hypothetical protein
MSKETKKPSVEKKPVAVKKEKPPEIIPDIPLAEIPVSKPGSFGKHPPKWGK